MPTVAISPTIIGRLQPGAGNQSANPSRAVRSTNTTGQRLNARDRISHRLRHRQLVRRRRWAGAGNWSQQATKASTTRNSAPRASRIWVTRLRTLMDSTPRTNPQPTAKTAARPRGTANSRTRKALPRFQARPMANH